MREHIRGMDPHAIQTSVKLINYITDESMEHPIQATVQTGDGARFDIRW